MDVLKPLLRGKKLRFEKGKTPFSKKKKKEREREREDMKVHFQYERLPIIWYQCGILDHNNQECPDRQLE